MNALYPQQQYVVYYPARYQAMWWQGIFSGLVGMAILVALGAWALSYVMRVLKGEEVEFPV